MCLHSFFKTSLTCYRLKINIAILCLEINLIKLLLNCALNRADNYNCRATDAQRCHVSKNEVAWQSAHMDTEKEPRSFQKLHLIILAWIESLIPWLVKFDVVDL